MGPESVPHTQKLEDARAKAETNEYRVLAERQRIEADPELFEQWQTIIEKGDMEALREKTERQVAEMLGYYFGKLTNVKNLLEYSSKRKKLKAFMEFTRGLTPVRNDSGEYEVFESPERTGNVSSFGPADVLCRAERYVYGSFREVGHFMARGAGATELDEEDIQPRAQILMNDIANVSCRVTGGESYLRPYLRNMFDYENGKTVLALYCACVFDSPDEAREFFSKTGDSHTAQRWDTEDIFPYVRSTLSVQEFDAIPEDERHAFLQQLRKRDEDRRQNILALMKRILHDTGIEPPLSLEVRIKDTAKRKM